MSPLGSKSIFPHFKRFEFILNNKTETFEKKIQSLIEVWKNISELNLVSQDIRYVVQIMDWAKLHALNTVLTAEWKDYKATYESKLLVEIEKAQATLLKLNASFALRCEKLAKVVRNPWEDPVLERLLSTKDAVIGPEEIDFFCMETAYLVSVRLKKLCESQCEDLALNLVTAFLACNKMSKTQNFSLSASDTQIWFIFDLYIALLYKYKENERIVALLKELSLEEGLNLIRRFAKKRVNISKIWRHCHRVAILSAHVFVSKAAAKCSEEHREVLANLVECFINISNTDSLMENFQTSMKRISQLADASGLYVFCAVVHRKVGQKLRPFTIEMYIRALTTDMNNLERQKNDNEIDKVVKTTKRLAEAFCNLADLLNDHVNVARECVLTAFSLEPTPERLKLIEDVARRSGFEVLDTGQEWKCKMHPPVLPSDDIAWTCPDCGDWMCKPQLNASVNTNTALFEALINGDLGISRHLCDDLGVCLSNPRYQVFSWLLEWPDLQRLCVMYMNDPERTKNIVTELKFVDIDYSIFKGIKREPVDELAGIEKGYEQYLDHDFASDDQLSPISVDSASQESRPYNLGSDGCDDSSPYNPLGLMGPQKSDPHTLKTLRMFRPSIKRTKVPGVEGPATKVFKLQGEGGQTNALGGCPQQEVPYYSMPSAAEMAASSSKSDSKNGLVATLSHGGQVAITSDPMHLQGVSRPADSLLGKCSSSPKFENNIINNSPKLAAALNSFLIRDNRPSTSISSQYPSNTNMDSQSCTPPAASPAPPMLITPFSSSSTLASPGTDSPPKPLFTGTNSVPSSTTQLSPCFTPPVTTISPHTPRSASPKHKSCNMHSQSRTPSPKQTLCKQLEHLRQTPPATSTIHISEAKALLTNNSPNKQTVPPTSSPPCNTFKGISVQDIIDKSNGNTTADKSPLKFPTPEEEQLIKKKMRLTSLVTKLQECDLIAQLTRRTNNNDDSTLSQNDKSLEVEDPPKLNSVSDTVLIPPPSNPLTVKRPNGIKRDIHSIPKKPPTTDKTIVRATTSPPFIPKKLKVVLVRCDNLLQQNAKRTVRKSENKSKKPPKRNNKKKVTSPLQDANPRVRPRKKFDYKNIPDSMNPRVVLERLPNDRKYAHNVLSNVPGLRDFDMVRPVQQESIVNVVQMSGNRTATTVQQPAQTSTQVTPHIQRIGQPRTDKPEPTTTASSVVTVTQTTTATTVVATVKPTTSQPSTLINILSQQIIRPSGQNNNVVARTRSSPLINILSQQIIRPNSAVITQKPPTSQPSEQFTIASKPPTTVATDQSTVVSQVTSSKTATTTTVKITNTTTTATTTPSQGTILQFICKSSLPKFQQAFGKTVYQNSTESSEGTATTTTTSVTPANKVETVAIDTIKKTPPKNIPVNVQPIQGSVIYTRQVPVGQTINLIPPGRGQVFRIATSNNEQISLVKDTVIHSKMSALLAAALQGKQKNSNETQTENESNSDEPTRVAVTTRPTLVQSARIVKPVLQIPSNVIRTSPQSSNNLSSTTLEQLREFDMVYKQIKERSSTSTQADNAQPEANEQAAPATTASPQQQRISVTYVNQGQKYAQLSPVMVVSSYCNLQPAASPALSVTSQGSSSPCVTPAPASSIIPKVVTTPTKSSKGKTLKNTTTTHTSKASPIPKPQQKPQEDEHTTQRIFDILAEYAEQLRNSPDLNNKPAPRRRSNPPTNPNQNSKRKKSSGGSKKSGQCSSMVSEADTEDQRTMGSEDSSCGVVQLSLQDDEPQVQSSLQTESNDSSSNSRQLILTDNATSATTTNNPTRNLIIADTSVGEALKMPNTAVLVPGNYIMPVSMVKGGQQIAVVSGGSKILATVPARSGPNMLLFQSFLNQNRKAGAVPTVKYSTIQPLSGISSQSLAGVSAQPPVILPSNTHNLTAVTLGQPLTLKKVDDSERGELVLTIGQSKENASKIASSSTATLENIPQQPDSSTAEIKIEDTVIQDSTGKVFQTTYQKSIIATPIATPVIAQASCIKEEPDETAVAAATIVQSTPITMNVTVDNASKEDVSKPTERVQSVLVTACTSNGPMLSHTPPRYRKPADPISTPSHGVIKEEFLHNGEKPNHIEQKHFQSSTVYYSNKTKKSTPRLDRELHQLSMQRKQAALEREIRLQKSLSEECEDLGVDEPSTSDLFPEADLLFDSNHSPSSFDHSTSELVVKRANQPDIKEETKTATMALFSDDDNSSSLRTDLFEYVEYHQAVETEMEYDQGQQMTMVNGQSSVTSVESGSSCEDNTLLQNCASMSDVTLNSPISPHDLYTDTPPPVKQYKFKYSNRKKEERVKQHDNWTVEVSSSEDTTGSTELGKHSPESCSNKRSHSISCGEDELSESGYKIVRIAISKSEIKEEVTCEEMLHCEEEIDCSSQSGRGARRTVKKTCSCCNGSAPQDKNKRPGGHVTSPAPQPGSVTAVIATSGAAATVNEPSDLASKKTFLNKKR